MGLIWIIFCVFWGICVYLLIRGVTISHAMTDTEIRNPWKNYKRMPPKKYLFKNILDWSHEQFMEEV